MLLQELSELISVSLLRVPNRISQRRRWHPTQYSRLENPMDRGAWWAAVHGVTRSRTRLSNFPFTFHFRALEKAMATHSSILAWRIPGTGEPGALPSMGSHRVGHDWSDLAAAAAGRLRKEWPIGHEDPLEEGTAAHCSIPAQRNPRTGEADRL